MPKARTRLAEGFSLLEIILSLTILGGAMAVLGEAVRNGMENARIARDTTDAQLYCESKMAELAAGLLTTDAVSDMPIEPMYDSLLESGATSDTGWLYSIDSEMIDENGLIQVWVTVSQDPTTVKTPVSFTMTRMVLDESLVSTIGTDTSMEEMF
jgi:type II secretory pathway pseudopilin PulG